MGTFYQRFKILREECGWTQDIVAEKLGVSRPTIAGYESEEKNRLPREETLHKIADLFDVSIDYLLGRTDDRSPSVQLDIPPDINVAYLDGVKHELTPEVARRLKEDIKLFEELKKQWKKNQEDH
ncbi:helix-turn-helix domain-containing protein [Paenibacillus sp. UNC451MF]|uniref:helix-turn-helix domain-containing protein n=1 Tax=Paenibacillus sp. UNC451MF TaxID=1449063 RepID=UPI00048B0EF6|nr:helix-turn-helix transcriptional regulator [Paenibacillus sp. UNC451MF]